MTFQQALTDHAALTGVGDVALSYQPSMLIGESSPLGGRWRASLASGAGLALVVCSIALLLQPPNPILLASATFNGALAAVFLWLARRLERRSRTHRRFLLLFSSEALQLEIPHFRGLSVRRSRLPFDAVRRVDVEGPEERRRLIVTWESNGPRRAVLVDKVPDRELEELYRLRRTLATAFGL